MSEPIANTHTFQVDHHGRTTDRILAADELAKAAYRAGKPIALVAGCELAETRIDLNAALERIKRLLDGKEAP